MSEKTFWVSSHYITPLLYGDFTVFATEAETDQFTDWSADNTDGKEISIVSNEGDTELRHCDVTGILVNCVQISVTNMIDEDEEDYAEAQAETRFYSMMEDRDFEMSCCVKECEWESRL